MSERALWLGVLLQAIDDYRGTGLIRDSGDPAWVRHDAAEFLFAAEREGDLELVAQAAGVDVDGLRRAARQPVAPGRRRQRIVGGRAS